MAMKLVSVKNHLEGNHYLWWPFEKILVNIYHWELAILNVEEKMPHFVLIPELRYDEISKA